MPNTKVITLYDTSSREGKITGSWNTMTLKTRLSLNFKKLQFQIVWLEYPEIEPTMQRIGVVTTYTKRDGSPLYTVPVIMDPNHTTPDGKPIIITDSWKIAEYLDEKYPEPGLLFPKGSKPLQSVFHDYAMKTILLSIGPILVTRVMDILNDGSLEYWRVTREAYLGAKLEEVCPKGSEKWNDTWKTLQKGFSEMAAHLDKNGPDNDFVIGTQATFADFILVSMLQIIYLVIPDEWEGRIQHWDNGKWKKIREGCAAWL
ncbi:hypothetical protein BU17DRAFT_63157 [Hysterangium stoloniferum]|nr:hypothetical protein BU17DRAFT_63157 [Hysterangium stoloniferum]